MKKILFALLSIVFSHNYLIATESGQPNQKFETVITIPPMDGFENSDTSSEFANSDTSSEHSNAMQNLSQLAPVHPLAPRPENNDAAQVNPLGQRPQNNDERYDQLVHNCQNDCFAPLAIGCIIGIIYLVLFVANTND